MYNMYYINLYRERRCILVTSPSRLKPFLCIIMMRGPNIYLQISQGWVSGGRGQALFSGAQRQDKGQRAQTEAEEAPAEHEEELLPSEGMEPWPRLPREAVESPSLEIFQTCLDKVLCSLLWVTMLWQEGWTRWPTEVPSNPYHSVIL